MNAKFALFTKDAELRASNIARIKAVGDAVPAFMNTKTKLDAKNTEGITVKALGNIYLTKIAQMSQKAALNVFRGHTITFLQCDEFAYLYNNHISLPVALFATNAARDNAKAAGEPYFNIFTTTAGKPSTPSGAYAYSVYTKAAKWSEELFDVNGLDKLHDIIKKQSRDGSGRMVIDMNHRQLGLTDQWLRDVIAESTGSSEEDIRADMLNQWVFGSKGNPIKPHILDKMMDNRKRDHFLMISEYGYAIRWYVPEEELYSVIINSHVIIGLDTSEAIGKDDIALIVRDSTTGKTLGAGTYNETNTIVFATWIASLLIEFKNAVLIPEKRSTLITIVDQLCLILIAKNINPFKRIFNRLVNDVDTHPARFEEFDKLTRGVQPRNIPISFINKYREFFGFATSGSGITSRTKLYGETLMKACGLTGEHAHDPELISQLGGLVTRNGRIDHEVSGNDDLCIAWLLSFWFLSNANNKGYYGLDERTVLADTTDISSDLSPEEMVLAEEQQILVEKITFLVRELKASKNSLLKIRIVNVIRMLSRKINEEYLRINNLHIMLETLAIINNTDYKMVEEKINKIKEEKVNDEQ